MATESDSVALATSQNENMLRQEPVESLDKKTSLEPSGQSGHLPVFEAFNELGLTGRDIATISVVTPPTVSKWRKGKVRIPDDRLVFLTLILAHLLDEAKAQSALEAEWSSENGAGHWSLGEHSRIDAARAHLSLQEVLNNGLPGSEIREGAKRFQAWWASGAAKALQEKHFQVALNGSTTRDLEILKARVQRR